MESQNITGLEALTPIEMDTGLVFSGVPTGNKIWGIRIPNLLGEQAAQTLMARCQKQGEPFERLYAVEGVTGY